MTAPKFTKIKQLNAHEFNEDYIGDFESFEQNAELLNEVDSLGNRALFDDFCDHFNTLCECDGTLYEVYFVNTRPNEKQPLFWQKLTLK